MSAKLRPYNVRAGSPRGAPMGRVNVGTAPKGQCVTVRLRRVPINASGYDGGGAYWGARPRGQMLFCAWTPDREFIRYMDAGAAWEAQEAIRREMPGADFLA